MENIELKKTPYNQIHHDLGAKMAEFAGYDMPIQYTGLVEEHNNVRNNVGVFDVSHMGEFRAKGPMAKQFMQYCTVNDVAALSDGKVQYTCLPNGKGGIVDDMLVYRIADDHYFMVPNAANIDKDWAWMSQIAEKFGMTLGEDFKNESEEWAQLAVQGPNALKAMQKLTKANVVDMEYYTFQIINFEARVAARSTSPSLMPRRFGTPSLRPARSSASCPQVWAAATPCVSRRASASTVTRSTTPSAPSRLVWVGSPSSSTATTSSTAKSSPLKRPMA